MNKTILWVIAIAGGYYLFTRGGTSSARNKKIDLLDTLLLQAEIQARPVLEIMSNDEIDVLYDVSFNYAKKGLPIPADLQSRVNQIMSHYGLAAGSTAS